MPSDLEKEFPNLHQTGFARASPRTPNYNCIAWAAGENHRRWWPSESPFAYWPEGVKREERLECFVAAFRVAGYEPCDDDKMEKGFEKVAIYVAGDGTPTHMARQLDSGEWTSKLGDLEDITHPSLFALEDSDYGKAVQILRRPRLQQQRT